MLSIEKKSKRFTTTPRAESRRYNKTTKRANSDKKKSKPLIKNQATTLSLTYLLVQNICKAQNQQAL